MVWKESRRLEEGKAGTHLHLTQRPKIQKTLHLLLNRITRITTTPPPEIIPRVRHLEQAHRHGPHHHMHRHHRIPDIPRHAADALHRLRAAAVAAEDDEVEEEGYERHGEEHNGRPEFGGGRPGVHVARQDVVLREEVFGKGESHGGEEEGGQDEGEDACDEAEDADVAFEFLGEGAFVNGVGMEARRGGRGILA
ncbi:hypothetical protein MMC24_000764 [Lignoscripta atroalba]|nr:hypothetical protein [Lignoscripta atroalba]